MIKYKKILQILLLTSVTSYALTSFFYWIINPDLSQMQVLLKFWYWVVINIFLALLSVKADL